MPGPDDRKNDKGFWDGGGSGYGQNDQSSGRLSGFPGERKPSRVGVRTDIEFPEQQTSPAKSKK
jgi:hypothetical protein